MSPLANAQVTHQNLLTALETLREAEGTAVLLFAEILNRKLFQSLGYPSIHHYAQSALGLSHGKTMQFIRLAESLSELPRLKESVRRGRTTWTKARVVVAVATSKTEAAWVHKAETRSRKDLESTVRLVRASQRGAGTKTEAEAEHLEVWVTKPFRLTPEQACQFETLSQNENGPRDSGR